MIEETDRAQLQYITVKIETPENSGTAFYYVHKESDAEEYLFLVTNKHLVNVEDDLKLNIKIQESNGKISFHPFIIKKPNEAFFFHVDSNIDLAIVPVNNIMNLLINELGKMPFLKWLSVDEIPSNEEVLGYSPVEDVVMVGYPVGMSDEVNMLPIIRKGVTASHYKFDFNGKKEGIVDIACFPGSSGSPILIYNEAGYTHNGKFNLAPRIKFLGVLHVGPQCIISDENNFSQMLNLGHFVKATEVNDLVKQYCKYIKNMAKIIGSISK